MGKKNNVNPNHYKEEGRERPGQDINQDVHKQQLTQMQNEQRREAGASRSHYIQGAASLVNESPAKDGTTDIGQTNESANSSSNT